MARLKIFICCFLMCWMISGLLAIPILDIGIVPPTSKCQSCPEKRPECEPDQVLVEVARGTGQPGSCCSHYKCVGEMPVCDRSIAPFRYYPNACVECTTCSICQSICPTYESEELLNCLTFNEEIKMKGDVWVENDGCTVCECDQQSERSCKTIQCLAPDCENPIQEEGACCPVCPSEEEEEVIRPSMGGTTSSPLLLLNTSTTEKIEDLYSSSPMPDEANDSSTSDTSSTTTSSVSSTESESSVATLGSSTTIGSPFSSTESDSATASEGPVVPPDFDEYSIEFSTERPTSTEDALPRASSDYPSTSEPPPPPPVSTSLVESNGTDSRTTRTVFENRNDDDDNFVLVKEVGAERLIWIGSVVIVIVGVLVFVAIFYWVMKQRNSKEQNTGYHGVSQTHPQPIVNTGLYPLLPAMGSDLIKE